MQSCGEIISTTANEEPTEAQQLMMWYVWVWERCSGRNPSSRIWHSVWIFHYLALLTWATWDFKHYFIYLFWRNIANISGGACLLAFGTVLISCVNEDVKNVNAVSCDQSLCWDVSRTVWQTKTVDSVQSTLAFMKDLNTAILCWVTRNICEGQNGKQKNN